MNNEPFSRKAGSQGEAPRIEWTTKQQMAVTGYHGYLLNNNSIEIKKAETAIKYQIIRPYIVNRIAQKSFVDIGCSAGAVGFQFIFDGCTNIDFIDHDVEYTRIVEKALSHISNTGQFNVYTSTLRDFKESYDAGIALAIIHWLYSYTDSYGSLSGVIGALKLIANETLIVEWVGTEDSAIQMAGHIFQNPHLQKEPYSYEAFQDALKEHYKNVKSIGQVNATREIWIASDEPIICDSGILKDSQTKIKEIRKSRKDKKFPATLSTRLLKSIRKRLK